MSQHTYWLVFGAAIAVCLLVGWAIGREAAHEARREAERWRKQMGGRR